MQTYVGCELVFPRFGRLKLTTMSTFHKPPFNASKDPFSLFWKGRSWWQHVRWFMEVSCLCFHRLSLRLGHFWWFQFDGNVDISENPFHGSVDPFFSHFSMSREKHVMVELFLEVHNSILRMLAPSVTPVRTFMMNSIDDNVEFSENSLSWLCRPLFSTIFQGNGNTSWDILTCFDA